MSLILLRTSAALARALACLVGSFGLAAACAYHGGGIGISSAHPGSIDVAIAVQVAVEAGTIETQSAAPPPASMVAYHRVVKQIEQFRNLLEAGQRRHAAPAFSLLLIDSALWSRFTPQPATGIELAIHTDAPAGDEPVVLSTGAVIRAVLAGRLSTADAIHRGLIRVEAGIDAKLALFDLLSAAAASR